MSRKELNKLYLRNQWDEDLIDSRVVENLSAQADIYQYAIHFMAPQPSRDFCELRCWREATYLNQKYAYVVYSSSIESESIQLIGDIRANTLKNFYLIEANSPNDKRCKLHQLNRADFRGYSSEWYNKIQAHLLKKNFLNLKECLQYK